MSKMYLFSTYNKQFATCLTKRLPNTNGSDQYNMVLMSNMYLPLYSFRVCSFSNSGMERDRDKDSDMESEGSSHEAEPRTIQNSFYYPANLPS